MSNGRSLRPAKDQPADSPTTLMVTMDDSQLNEILLPVLGEINSLRRRVEALEEKSTEIDQLKSIVEFLKLAVFDDGR